MSTESLTASHGAASAPVAAAAALAVVGQVEELATVGLLDADESFVLELLERRVDRARTRAPDALAPSLDLLHELVAVARLLGEQGENRGADVTAPCPAPAATRGATGSEAPRAAEREAAPAAVAVAAVVVALAGHCEPAEPPGVKATPLSSCCVRH